MEIRKIRGLIEAAKLVHYDAFEAFRTVETMVGTEVALAMLIMQQITVRGSGRYPVPEGTEEMVEMSLREAGLVQ